MVASLAAGEFFHGFETSDLADAGELDWAPVPPHLAKPRRFVVRVTGDSMTPTLNIGDLVIFEYHRSPRRDGEIVIANLPEFGPATDGTEAIKRITQDPTHWIFKSDNPAYEPVRVPKTEIAHPILGTLVQRLGGNVNR